MPQILLTVGHQFWLKITRFMMVNLGQHQARGNVCSSCAGCIKPHHNRPSLRRQFIVRHHGLIPTHRNTKFAHRSQEFRHRAFIPPRRAPKFPCHDSKIRRRNLVSTRRDFKLWHRCPKLPRRNFIPTRRTFIFTRRKIISPRHPKAKTLQKPNKTHIFTPNHQKHQNSTPG